MAHSEFARQQFIALRREIKGQQSRLFWIVVIGLLGLPFLSCVLWGANNRAWIVLPFFVLALIILFLAQQSQLMRAARYIREFLENDVDPVPGWETWLESRSELRLIDRYFSACFIVIFFVHYFLSVALALRRLWLEAAGDPSGIYWQCFCGAASVYTITTLWALAALCYHWKSSTNTTPSSTG
jgi:hypothetical protein